MDEWDHFLGFGSLHILTTKDDEPDAVEQLRRVVEEVTGKEVPREEPRRIGFI